jgi:acetoin utilization deacetylase AcuC-like enzyme
MKIAFSSLYAHPLPAGHRFPMIKYELLAEQLVYEGSFNPGDFIEPEPIPKDLLALTHSPEWIHKLNTGMLSRQEERRTGFPFSYELLRREEIITGGTLQLALYALENGCGGNIAGGTHHAYRSHGEGFCLYNDIAVAANALLLQKKVKQILIVDLDVHQGNGTASIFQQEKRVFTFSMHGKNNFPLHKERSDLDIELDDGTGDASYLRILENRLTILFEQVQPDFVFYLSGADVLATDKLGRLGLTPEGCRQRDKIVISRCSEAGLPIVAAMGGGYSEDIRLITEAHAHTFRLLGEYYD